MGIRSPTLLRRSAGDPTGAINRRTWAFMILPFIEQAAIFQAINFSLPFNPPTGAANNTVSESLIAGVPLPRRPDHQPDRPEQPARRELRRQLGVCDRVDFH